MPKETESTVDRRKFGLNRWVSLGLGLLASTCLAKDAVHAQRIFRCEAHGRIIFSDLPCVTVPRTEVTLRPGNSYHADAPAPEPSKPSIAAADGQETRQSEAIVAEQQRAKQRCQRIADQLANIENTMRSGYSVKQGEHLRERQRQLEQQRRTERCR